MSDGRSRTGALTNGIICAVGILLFLIASTIVLSLIPIYLPVHDSTLNDVQDQTQLFYIEYSTTVDNETINYPAFVTDLTSATQQLNEQLGLPPNTIIIEKIELVRQSNSGRTIRKKRALNYIILLTCRANYPRMCRFTACRQEFLADISQRFSNHRNIIFRLRLTLVVDQIIQFDLQFIEFTFVGTIVIPTISFTAAGSVPTKLVTTARTTSKTTTTSSTSKTTASTITTSRNFTISTKPVLLTSTGLSNNKIVGGYWPNFVTDPSPIRIRDIHPNYNLIYLFSAVPVGASPGTTGEIRFDDPDDGRGAKTNLINDLQYARNVQNRKIILSVGGAGNSMSFPNRTKSQTFVNSVVALYERFGGFDGLDWDTFEGDQEPDTNEMIWISKELKRRYPGFLITSPPAPYRQVDKDFCQAMVQANAMDYAAPQYYDGPDLANQSYIVNHTSEWVSLLGATHVVVGFGVDPNKTNYMTIDQAVATWNEVKSMHPTLRGAFDWEVHSDEAQGWAFATNVGPLVTGSR